MAEYEIDIGTKGSTSDQAIAEYMEKVQKSFETHRTASNEYKAECETKLNDIADRYSQIGEAFHKEDTPAENEVMEVMTEELLDTTETGSMAESQD